MQITPATWPEIAKEIQALNPATTEKISATIASSNITLYRATYPHESFIYKKGNFHLPNQKIAQHHSHHFGIVLSGGVEHFSYDEKGDYFEMLDLLLPGALIEPTQTKDHQNTLMMNSKETEILLLLAA